MRGQGFEPWKALSQQVLSMDGFPLSRLAAPAPPPSDLQLKKKFQLFKPFHPFLPLILSLTITYMDQIANKKNPASTM